MTRSTSFIQKWSRTLLCSYGNFASWSSSARDEDWFYDNLWLGDSRTSWDPGTYVGFPVGSNAGASDVILNTVEYILERTLFIRMDRVLVAWKILVPFHSWLNGNIRYSITIYTVYGIKWWRHYDIICDGNLKREAEGSENEKNDHWKRTIIFHNVTFLRKWSFCTASA